MAVVGDVFSDCGAQIANNAYKTIQPATGYEAAIHNIYFEDDIEIEWYDGTNTVAFDSVTGKGVYPCYGSHVTNSIYIRVKNVGGEAHSIGFDGVYTKVP
ncbi:MAG: hypothetical protein ACUVTR_01995 [Dehalococcoidia bacterium]